MRMSESSNRKLSQGVEREIDTVLAEFGGDARLAIAALLHDLTTLAEDCSNVVSIGFVRGHMPSKAKKSPIGNKLNAPKG